jgi:hypothetical protein
MPNEFDNHRKPKQDHTDGTLGLAQGLLDRRGISISALEEERQNAIGRSGHFLGK